MRRPTVLGALEHAPQSKPAPDDHWESRSSKTNATQCLIAELAQAGIPSVIFDYGQGFEIDTLDKHFRRFTNPAEYLIGEKGWAINPVEIFPRDVKGPNTVATRISDAFDAVYRLGDIQRKVFIDAIINLEGVTKTFGRVRALRGVSFSRAPQGNLWSYRPRWCREDYAFECLAWYCPRG